MNKQNKLSQFFIVFATGICVAILYVTTIQLLVFADTLTPNLSLTKPSIGSAGWGTTINTNYDTIDALFGSTTGHDHTGVAGKGPKIPITGGGTNATTAATARSNLGAAASGANTDITSLTGLTGNAIGVGTTSPSNMVHISSDSSQSQLALDLATDTANNRPIQVFRKANGSIASPTTVAQGDTIGSIIWVAYDGNSYNNTAEIAAQADGVIGDGDTPSRITFQVTPDGSATRAVVMTIKESGNVGIGDTTPARPLEVTGAMRLTPQAAAPASPASGDLYVDSTPAPDALCYYNGTDWDRINAGGSDADCS